ncbi:MAG: hypothetical protein RRY99_18670, partial [Flavobacterium sp.]
MNKKLDEENKALRVKSDSEQVEVGCNLVMGYTLASTGGDIDIEIKYGENILLSYEDVKTLLKNGQNRAMFVNCLLYFVDESYYKDFGVKKKFDICDENIIRVVQSNDENAMIRFFDMCTSKRFDTDVTHT